MNKKMSIFFCDIRGTIVDKSKEPDKEEFERFIQNLESLKQTDKLENLYFSFISGDHVEDVAKQVEIIKPYLNKSSIKLGPQFSSTHVFFDNKKYRCGSGKSYQIKTLIDEVEKLENIDFQKCYLADDTEQNHKVFIHTMNKKFPEVQYENFIIGNKGTNLSEYYHKEKGINALNELLEIYIEKNKEKNNNNKINKEKDVKEER